MLKYYRLVSLDFEVSWYGLSKNMRLRFSTNLPSLKVLFKSDSRIA